MISTQTNWAGNITFSAAHLHIPTRLDQLQDIVRRSRKVRAVGSRHSFNTIADCSESLISLEKFDQVLAIDRTLGTVTVGGGIKYGPLCAALNRAGFALRNLASLPHITVVGACATATHGSGDTNGNLATAVSAIQFINAEGELCNLARDKDGDRFRGAVVALGGLGVVTQLTLDIVPAFQMRQDNYENLPFACLEQNFDEVSASAYSVSLLMDWRSESINYVWLKRRVIDNELPECTPNFYEALRQKSEISPENYAQRLRTVGSWHERLPHFGMDETPSNGDELQSEYYVPRQYAYAAVNEVRQLHDKIAPLLYLSEVRTIAADDLWLSPCYGQACVAIHFTWKNDWPGVSAILPTIEAKLERFQARPHWGKLFTMTPSQLQTFYPRLPDFRGLMETFDPHGKFRNDFVDRYLL